jgi:hypothetical protein
MRLRRFVLVLVAAAAVGTRPAAAQDGGAGLGLVWAQPTGAFARTADPTVGISMWLAIGPPRSGWAVRGDFHFIEEHLVADGIPNTHFVPAPGLTAPALIPLYTDIVGVTFGPMRQAWSVEPRHQLTELLSATGHYFAAGPEDRHERDYVRSNMEKRN